MYVYTHITTLPLQQEVVQERFTPRLQFYQLFANNYKALSTKIQFLHYVCLTNVSGLDPKKTTEGKLFF